MRWAGARYVLVAGLAVLCLAGLVVTGSNYIQGMKSARQLELAFAGVEVEEEPLAQVIVRFQLDNRSSLPMTLADLDFSLFLNEEYIVSQQGSMGWRKLAANETAVLEFALPLQPLPRQRVQAAQAAGDWQWSLRGTRKVVLPYRDRTLFIQMRQQWSPP